MVLLFFVFFILSCAHFTPKVIETPSFKKWVSSSTTPKVIAILPFTNETEVEGLNQLVREGFYKHFSVRSFHDVEIKEIDTTIKMLAETEGKDLYKISPKNLGEFLLCDALVYGRVTKFKRIFLLIYTQMLIEAEIRIVDAQSGKDIWKHSLIKRFHEGGVPTGPFGVIPTAIRTTYSLRESKRNRDIDAFCKDFVRRIPEIKYPHAKKFAEFCDVQLASFRLKEGALHISSELSQHGYKPFLRETDINGELWYRVMVGPFASRDEAVHNQVKLKKDFSFLNPFVVRDENSNNVVIKKDIGESFEVQVASFKLEEGASTISSKLFQHGYKPFLAKINNNGELWYRVMVGPFISRDEAEHHQAKLEREFKFLQPIIIRSKNYIQNDNEELYDVQVAFFKIEEGALHISSKLSQHGFRPFLTRTNTDDELWYSVMVGPFVSKTEAEERQVKIRKEFSFLNPIVVRSKNSGNFGSKKDAAK